MLFKHTVKNDKALLLNLVYRTGTTTACIRVWLNKAPQYNSYMKKSLSTDAR